MAVVGNHFKLGVIIILSIGLISSIIFMNSKKEVIFYFEMVNYHETDFKYSFDLDGISVENKVIEHRFPYTFLEQNFESVSTISNLILEVNDSIFYEEKMILLYNPTFIKVTIDNENNVVDLVKSKDIILYQ